MSAQGQRALVVRIKLTHQLGPQQPSRPHLGHLHEIVHADGPEERQARREGVDLHARSDAGAHVLDPVGERIGQLQVGRGAGLLHVVAADGDGVELGRLLRRIGEDVGDDPHAGRRRIDVGVPDHELLQNVVLDRAGELGVGYALFFGGGDIERQHRQHRAVHGHGHAHLIERDAAEQGAHVQDRVDRHPRHADVARHPRVVAVVAAVGGQVESDRQPLLTGGEVAAIEGVGLLGGGEAGVLADGPRVGHVHGRVGATHVRRDAGIAAEEVEALQIGGTVSASHPDAFGRVAPLIGQAGRERGEPHVVVG